MVKLLSCRIAASQGYEVYGNQIDGLERDFRDNVNYFGKEFIEIKKNLHFYQNPFCESFGESQGCEMYNQLIMLNS